MITKYLVTYFSELTRKYMQCLNADNKHLPLYVFVIIRCFEAYVTMTSVVVVVVGDQVVSVHWNVGGVCVSKGQLLVPLSVHRGWRCRCCSTFPSGDSRLSLASSQDARELRGR